MILVWLMLIPLVGGLAAWLVGGRSPRAARWVSLLALGVDLALVAGLWASCGGQAPLGARGPWLAEFDAPWIPPLGIRFTLAMDGLSLVLVALTCFLGFLAVAASWRSERERVGFFHFNLLWMLAAIIGVFLALDLILFYFVWEMMLVPLYLLIVLWGHERRVYAAIKFFLFTQASGLLMLASIVGLYFVHGRQTGVYTFDYHQLLDTPMSGATAMWLLLGFLASFLVKLAVVPVHTWLPDAHTQAPTAGSVGLAGLVLKIGAYGLIRFALPLFPGAAQEIAPVANLLAVASILYGAVLAFSQTDLKRLVAYTSVSHMGFVLLGIFAGNEQALQGAILVMVAHGLSTSGLFILVGNLQERLGTRDLGRMGGLWAAAPRLGAVALVLALASLGLPGMANFVGEFLVLLGAWKAGTWWVVPAALGLVVSAIYSLWLVQRAFQGPNERNLRIPDLSAREGVIFASLIAGLLVLGVYPKPILATTQPVVAAMMQSAPTRAAVVQVEATVDRGLKSEIPNPAPTGINRAALLPLAALAAAIVVLLLVIAFVRSHALAFALTLAGLAAALAMLPFAAAAPSPAMTLLTVDGYALFFMALTILAAAAVAGLSHGYLAQRDVPREEFYVLLLLATLGAATLAASSHFVSFFLGIETLSVSLYALIGYLRGTARGVEAALKYLILAAAASACILFGMALIYAHTGTLEFARIAVGEPNVLVLAGLALLLAGVGFKLGVVPFHMWTPDVYEGAPAPVSALIATMSKGAVVAVVIRFLGAGWDGSGAVATLIAVLAAASMVGGNLLALLQNDLKRLLAYSSIAHLGYLLVAFAASGSLRVTAVGYYLAAYFVTTLGAFGIIALLSGRDGDAASPAAYRGLAWRRPWLAGVLVAMLLSLAGVPLTAGFVGKLAVLAAAMQSQLYGLAIVLVLTSAVGLFFYLRVIVALFAEPAEAAEAAPPATRAATRAAPTAGVAVVAALAVALVWLGTYPAPLLRVIERSRLAEASATRQAAPALDPDPDSD